MESSDDASDLDDGSERSVRSSEPSEFSRPNRFKGPGSTWRMLTEDERLVSTSMTQLRDQNLSVHLYNAHAMKRRHYGGGSASQLKAWASKERWRGNRIGEDDESSTNFVPPRSWTAWPLSADVVPRSGEQIGAEDDADDWTLKRREPHRPSRELEDILMAIILRVSRDRFETREWESSQEHEERKAADEALHINAEVEAQEAQGEKSQDVLPSASKHILVGADIQQEALGPVNWDGTANDASNEADQPLDDLSLPERGPEQGHVDVPLLERPTISADDERSRRLLRPTIRHTLSRLDQLLMALHNARQTCLYYASEHTESQSEFEGVDTAADDSDKNNPSHLTSSIASSKPPLEQPTQRSGPGRPPKVLHMPAPSAAEPLKSVEPHKTERRGRKRKFRVPLEGESHEEMLVRIARLQKKAIPFTSAPTGSASSSPAKLTRGSPQKRGTSAHTREKRSMRLGLRDWSEILGTAALLHFSPKVIDRTTQRCANLFGEGMTILSLAENPTSGDEDQIVDYLPGGIPDFDNLEHRDSAGSKSEELPETLRRQPRPPSRGHGRNRLRSDNEMDISKSEGEIRTSSGGDKTYYCSYTDCLRHKRGFSKRHYLTRHLRDVHKLDKEELRETQEDSQEEMEGGVHVNGFLKVVKRRTGWRALDGRPRRRKKSGGPLTSEDPEEDLIKKGELSEWSGGGLVESGGSLDEAFESD